MQIRLNAKTDVENKGKYNMAVVHYDQDGQSKEKKLMSFTFPDVYKTLVNANVGDAYDIKAEKDGKFWNWVQASLVGGAGAPANSNGSTTSTSLQGVDGRLLKNEQLSKYTLLDKAVYQPQLLAWPVRVRLLMWSKWQSTLKPTYTESKK